MLSSPCSFRQQITVVRISNKALMARLGVAFLLEAVRIPTVNIQWSRFGLLGLSDSNSNRCSGEADHQHSDGLPALRSAHLLRLRQLEPHHWAHCGQGDHCSTQLLVWLTLLGPA